MPVGPPDLQQNHAMLVHHDFEKLKRDLRVDQSEQPVFEFLVANFGATRVEVGSHDFMGCVVYTPYQVTVCLVKQGCGIRQRRYVLADVFGPFVITLEFQPFCFDWEADQFAHKTGKALRMALLDHGYRGAKVIASSMLPSRRLRWGATSLPVGTTTTFTEFSPHRGENSAPCPPR